MADCIPLPPSGRSPYSEAGWEKTEQRLKELISPSVEDVESAILEHLNDSPMLDSRFSEFEGVGTSQRTFSDLPGLREVLTGDKCELYLNTAVPAAARFACRLPDLLPSLSLSRLKSGHSNTVILTRHQVASLLGHMFFCTTVPQGLNEHSVHFGMWHTCVLSPALAYLRCLLDYFLYIDNLPFEVLDSTTVTFSRHYLSAAPDWMNSTASFEVEVVPEIETRISDLTGPAEVDFANKKVGYGETGTQEELIFGMSPEMCVVVLMNEVLLDTDALHIVGAVRVGTFSGYGLDVEYLGVNQHLGCVTDWASRTVIAMDAIPYWVSVGELSCLLKQLQNESLERELNKAFCAWAFQGEDIIKLQAVSTGHWGCGAFGGNKDVKAFIQLAAAAEAHVKKLHYHTFGDEEFATKLMNAVNVWKERKATVGDVMKLVGQYKEQLTTVSSPSFLEKLVANFRDKRTVSYPSFLEFIVSHL